MERKRERCISLLGLVRLIPHPMGLRGHLEGINCKPIMVWNYSPHFSPIPFSWGLNGQSLIVPVLHYGVGQCVQICYQSFYLQKKREENVYGSCMASACWLIIFPCFSFFNSSLNLLGTYQGLRRQHWSIWILRRCKSTLTISISLWFQLPFFSSMPNT